MRKSTPKIVRPPVRWLVSVDDARPLAWRGSTIQAVNYCRIRGDKFIGLFNTEAEALAAMAPAPTMEQQAEVLIGGLVASVVATRRVA